MDKYTILKVIGEGTYGRVYKATDKAFNQTVAIKQFKNVEDNDLGQRELLVCSMLNHENIVTFCDSFKYEGTLHLVFEYMQDDLVHVINRASPNGLDNERVIELTYQLCKAVHCCHQNRIIHRDLKPENILIDAVGTLQLCDFGVAKVVKVEGDLMTDYVATRWYRPPEQELRCTQYSFSADIWSIGCIAFELWMGKPLFPGETQLEQIGLIQEVLGAFPKDYSNKLPRTYVNKKKKSCLKDKMEGKKKKKMNPHVLDFIQRTVVLVPNQRMSAQECLHHPLFRSLQAADEEKKKKRGEEVLESSSTSVVIEEEMIQRMSSTSISSCPLMIDESSMVIEEDLQSLSLEEDDEEEEGYEDDFEVSGSSHTFV